MNDMLIIVLGIIIGAAVGYAIAAFKNKATVAGIEVDLRRSKEEEERLRIRVTETARDRDDVHRLWSDSKNQLAKEQESLRLLQNQITTTQEQMTAHFKTTAEQVLKSITVEQGIRSEKELRNVVAPLEKSLEQQSQLISQLNRERAYAEGELQGHVETLQRLQLDATTAATKLNGALSDNRRRGSWGEVQLKNVLELSGMQDGIDYQEQQTDGQNKRPDFVINLPNNRCVIVDSKTPLTNYLVAVSAETSKEQAEEAADRHVADIKTHIKALRDKKYPEWQQKDCVEFTVMFIPVEGAIALAMNRDPELYEYALKSKVVLSSASTLLIILKTCAIYWQRQKMEKNAQEIEKVAQDLLDNIQEFCKDYGDVNKKIESAQKTVQKVAQSLKKKVLPGTRKLAELSQHKEQELAELDERVEAIQEIAELMEEEPLPACPS